MIGGRKHEAQNKSTAIQIPPLHTTLIETHQALAKKGYTGSQEHCRNMQKNREGLGKDGRARGVYEGPG